MGEMLIRGLIGLCLRVGAVYVALWVFAALGIVLPAMIVKIIWIVVVLVAVLYVYRALKAAGGASWLP